MRVWLVLLLAVGGATASGFAQTNTQAVNQSDAQRRLDERAPIWLKAFNVTGIGIAYIENGKIAWTAFYGDQVPGGPLANEKTLYSVASLTKTITADIILRLASDEKLSLDESIAEYWIDPDVKDNAWNKLLTPRLCLSHQTGLPNWRAAISVATRNAIRILGRRV